MADVTNGREALRAGARRLRDAERPSTTAYLQRHCAWGRRGRARSFIGDCAAASSAIRCVPVNGLCQGTTAPGASIVQFVSCRVWRKPYTQREPFCSACTEHDVSPTARLRGLQYPEVRPVESTSQPRLTISVSETADLLGISRWLAYEQIQRGELPVIRMGRRLRVPVRPVLALVGMSWEDWLATQPRLRSA